MLGYIPLPRCAPISGNSRIVWKREGEANRRHDASPNAITEMPSNERCYRETALAKMTPTDSDIANYQRHLE